METIERAKIIDRAKKLKELADRGVGGEKDNAKNMLDAHKAKYNITDQEISGHKYSQDFAMNFAKMSESEFLAAMFDKLANDKDLQQSIFRLASALADALFKPRR